MPFLVVVVCHLFRWCALFSPFILYLYREKKITRDLRWMLFRFYFWSHHLQRGLLYLLYLLTFNSALSNWICFWWKINGRKAEPEFFHRIFISIHANQSNDEVNTRVSLTFYANWINMLSSILALLERKKEEIVDVIIRRYLFAW